jgi:hypothetical protein
MMRACAAGIEREDRGNDALFQLRDVKAYARDSGYMSVEEECIAEQQSEVEPSFPDHDIRNALDGSQVAKNRTVAFEAGDDGRDAERMLKLIDIYAEGLGRRSFTIEERIVYDAGLTVPLRPKPAYKPYTNANLSKNV